MIGKYKESLDDCLSLFSASDLQSYAVAVPSERLLNDSIIAKDSSIKY